MHLLGLGWSHKIADILFLCGCKKLDKRGDIQHDIYIHYLLSTTQHKGK